MYIDKKIVPTLYIINVLYCIITRAVVDVVRNILLLYYIIIETVIGTLLNVVTLISITQVDARNIITENELYYYIGILCT